MKVYNFTIRSKVLSVVHFELIDEEREQMKLWMASSYLIDKTSTCQRESLLTEGKCKIDKVASSDGC